MDSNILNKYAKYIQYHNIVADRYNFYRSKNVDEKLATQYAIMDELDYRKLKKTKNMKFFILKANKWLHSLSGNLFFILSVTS